MKNLNNRVAVITGAASGIGRALAIQLRALGCDLALADMDKKGLKTLQNDLGGNDTDCLLYTLDVSDQSAMTDFAATVEKQFGQVHMLFNNAGVSLLDKAERQSINDMEWVMNINFWGVVYGCTAFMPLMQKVDEAHIINISSLFGLVASPLQSAYNASKFAVRGYSEALKMELCNSHINLSCVHPGGIKTNIISNLRISDNGLAASRGVLETKFMSNAPTTADQAATIILKGVSKNRRRIIVGRDAKFIDFIARLFPNSYEKILKLEDTVI